MTDLKIKETAQKKLHIPALTGGLDLADLRDKTPVNTLKICKNMWQRNGILESRPALFTNENCILGDGEYYYSDPSLTELTNIEYEYDGTVYRLVYKSVEVDIATHFCYTNLIGPDGKMFKTAQILFLRTSSDTFYIPKKFNFFKGKPVSSNGTGIYLLVKLVNCENSSQTNSKIYELDTSLESWREVYSSYIPTVLINGRGNRYEEARQTDQVFTGNPKRLEGLSALTPDFYSYFSSDGRSSSFRLPFSSLSPNEIIARFYYSGSNYAQWHISAHTNQASATLYNVTVTMTVNRESGIVSFTSSGGEYSLPLVSERNENNLRILAKKESGYTLDDITEAEACLNLNGKIFLGSKNRIFSSNFENPLYFPAESVCTLWGEDTRVTALASISQRLLAFTKNRIYIGEIKDGKNLNSYSLLADNDSVFNSPHSVELECLNYHVGCRQKNSVITDGKEAFFLSSGGEFYCLSQNETKNISLKIKDFLPLVLGEYSAVSGFKYKNSLLFLWENKTLCFDRENNAWYYWEFNENIKFSGAFNTEKGPRILLYSSSKTLHFTATLKGDVDIFFKGSFRSPILEENAIPCIIRTNNIAPECISNLNNITSLNISLECERAEISVNDIHKTRVNRTNSKTPVKLISPVTNAHSFYIAIKSTAPLKVGSICTSYTPLGL